METIETKKLDPLHTEYHVAPDENRWADVDHPFFFFDGDGTFKDTCVKKLDELSSLNENWDGEGAPVINQRILRAAKEFIESLPNHVAPQPMIVPVTSGGVQLEWHDGQRVLEIEFESPADVHYLKWDPDNAVEEEDTVAAADRAALVGLMRWFMKGFFDGK